MYTEKSTFDINDRLLARAKRHAQKAGKPLRALVEEGLRRVLDDAPTTRHYELPDRAVGSAESPNPLEHLSWQDLCDEIYGAGLTCSPACTMWYAAISQASCPPQSCPTR